MGSKVVKIDGKSYETTKNWAEAIARVNTLKAQGARVEKCEGNTKWNNYTIVYKAP